jgi:hypothetical protein
MKKLLLSFSYIFHPLFTPIMGALLYFLYTRMYFSDKEIYFYLIQIGILTILIPIAVFFLLKTIHKIDSGKAETTSERKLPLLIHCILMGVLIQKGVTVHRIPELYIFLLGGLISNIIALLFLFVSTKISLHMIGITALVSFAFALTFLTGNYYIYSLAFLVMMIGGVATSRLLMKAHNYKELILGFITGLLPQLLLWRYWL